MTNKGGGESPGEGALKPDFSSYRRGRGLNSVANEAKANATCAKENILVSEFLGTWLI